jgi:hypothetical protein
MYVHITGVSGNTCLHWNSRNRLLLFVELNVTPLSPWNYRRHFHDVIMQFLWCCPYKEKAFPHQKSPTDCLQDLICTKVQQCVCVNNWNCVTIVTRKHAAIKTKLDSVLKKWRRRNLLLRSRAKYFSRSFLRRACINFPHFSWAQAAAPATAKYIEVFRWLPQSLSKRYVNLQNSTFHPTLRMRPF